MPNDTNTSTTVTYGSLPEIDLAKLPHSSVMAMFRRGISHYFGNEQASKLTAFFGQKDEAGNLVNEDTPEARAAKKAELQQAAFEALLAGKVGVSVRGPAADPITAIIRRLARAEVTNILKANGVKFPSKAEDTIEMPDGSKFTGAQLIDRRIAKEGERLAREAKKIADDQAKKAAKAQEAAKAEGLGAL